MKDKYLVIGPIPGKILQTVSQDLVYRGKPQSAASKAEAVKILMDKFRACPSGIGEYDKSIIRRFLEEATEVIGFSLWCKEQCHHIYLTRLNEGK